MNSKQLNVVFGAIAAVAILTAVYFAYSNKTEAPTLDNANVPINTNTSSANINKPANTNQNTNSTSTWKTYTNSQFGFQFKYPANSGYLVKESCPTVFEKPTCSITMENSNSALYVVIDSPGHGWFGVDSPQESGNINVGGVNTTYRYGPSNTEGGPTPNTKVFLTNFSKNGSEYALAFLNTGIDDKTFLEDIVKPLLVSAKFTK